VGSITGSGTRRKPRQIGAGRHERPRHERPPKPGRGARQVKLAGATAAVLAGVACAAFVPQVRDLASTPSQPGQAASQDHQDQAATPLADYRGPLHYLAPPANNQFWFPEKGYPPWRTHPELIFGSGYRRAQPPKTKPVAKATPTPQPTHQPTHPPVTTHGGAACAGHGGGMVPQNYAAIVDYLVGHGYARLAAAGIAGNIYQESGGNPESEGSGGGGLIGWTPLPAGFVTGNPSADLQTQLAALLQFNQQWSSYIPALNATTSAASAADIYMTDFERPGIPAVGNREAAATAVATACGF
jgi:hypothetical protein